MSGGFFRGTSAEQDTRFSNKQAKLLKSQKFAPELDHLVDMSKVKMDVVRPWIAKRVTELLGFEDEVLINFIYGLLDGKDVNGKEIQIQLTGFMEKNTGKFMKELWVLLLSAQKNVSGVPQQFLDAKEEETRKMKTEADRITLEIQKKKEKEKEGRELEQEKFKKLDGEGDISRSTNAASNSTLKHSLPRDSIDHPEDEKEADKRNGSRGKSRVFISSHPADSSPSSHRSTPSRSVSKPFSNSRSYSGERHKSRSISGSPKSRRRSVSPERPYNSPQRRTISPLRMHSPRRPRSPLRRGSSYSRRRSRSYSQHRSPSPARRRLLSPSRRRSPSPMRRRRSASPRRQRSSPLRRSPSPARRRSPPPIRRRSPSPTRRRSPSPVRRRSPLTARRRSPIPSPGSPPYRRRSPSPPWRRSRSPVRRRSPKHRRRSPVQSPRQRFRSRSPYRSRSPAYRSHKSLRRDHDIRTNGVESKRYRDDYAVPRTSNRACGKISPANNSTESEEVELSGQTHTERDSMSRRPPISLRSPQRDPRDLNNNLQKVVALSPTPEKSPSSSESSPHTRKTIPSEDRKGSSMYDSPVRQRRERTTYGGSAGSSQRIREQTADRGNPEASGEEEEINRARTVSSPKRFRLSPTVSNWKNSPAKDYYKEYPSKRLTSLLPNEAQGPQNNEPKKKDRDRKSEKGIARMVHPESLTQQKSTLLDESHYSLERPKGEIFSEDYVCNERLSAKKHDRDYSSSGERLKRSCPGSSHKAEKGKHSHLVSVEDSDWSQRKEVAKKLMKQADHYKKSHSFESGSEESDEDKHEVMEKRKHRRSDRHEVISDDDGSYDSQINEKKEAKRRRKEEKRLRKEEKRRRREERRRRKEERRARKLKLKSNDIEIPPSDFEKNPDSVYNSDGELVVKKPSHPSDTEEIECEQKKLEIELRKKALESLRAKKGIGH